MWIKIKFKKPKHKLIWIIVLVLGFIPLNLLDSADDVLPYLTMLIIWFLFGWAILHMLSNMKETIMKDINSDFKPPKKEG